MVAAAGRRGKAVEDLFGTDHGRRRQGPVRRRRRSEPRRLGDRPGELIHLDIKKLGRFEQIGHRITGERAGQRRGAGWEFVDVCLDDASRIAFAQVCPTSARTAPSPSCKLPWRTMPASASPSPGS